MFAARRVLSVAGLGLVLALTGCVVAPGPAEPESDRKPVKPVVLQTPTDQLTVLGDPDPTATSVALRGGLFTSAPAVVIAAADDATAASAAVALGVPLLVPGKDPKPVQEEVSR